MVSRSEIYRDLAMQDAIGALRTAYRPIAQMQFQLAILNPSSKLLKLVELNNYNTERETIQISPEFWHTPKERTGESRREFDTFDPNQIGEEYAGLGRYINLLEAEIGNFVA